MNRKIIIFGSSIQRANDKLQSLLDNMRVGDIEQVHKEYNDFTVQLKMETSMLLKLQVNLVEGIGGNTLISMPS